MRVRFPPALLPLEAHIEPTHISGLTKNKQNLSYKKGCKHKHQANSANTISYIVVGQRIRRRKLYGVHRDANSYEKKRCAHQQTEACAFHSIHHGIVIEEDSQADNSTSATEYFC